MTSTVSWSPSVPPRIYGAGDLSSEKRKKGTVQAVKDERGGGLPPSLHTFFWEYDAATLDIQKYATFVMERLMERGSWEAMQWLLTVFSRAQRYTYLQTRGRKILSPKALNYWAIMSDVPELERQQWVADARARDDIWSNRVASRHPE